MRAAIEKGMVSGIIGPIFSSEKYLLRNIY